MKLRSWIAGAICLAWSAVAAGEEPGSPAKKDVELGERPTLEQENAVDFTLEGVFADARLEPKSGSNASGTVVFSEDDGDVRIIAYIKGAEPGLHGLHVHEKGDCSAKDASSAGGHFNPTEHSHGAPDPAEHHVGDLGNIKIGPQGSGVKSLTFKAETKQGVDSWGIYTGKAVVLHKKADDLTSQPSGDAGPRVACGVIEPVESPGKVSE